MLKNVNTNFQHEILNRLCVLLRNNLFINLTINDEVAFGVWYNLNSERENCSDITLARLLGGCLKTFGEVS